MAEIVVGVDGSPGSLEALRWAATEARLREASLRLVHAWMVPLLEAMPEPWVLGAPAASPSEEEVYTHLQAGAGAVLDAALAAAREQEPGLPVEGSLVEARPARALIDAAREADLLVVGSRGRGGFAGLLLGSASAQCVHHAPCPVVVVPARREDD